MSMLPHRRLARSPGRVTVSTSISSTLQRGSQRTRPRQARRSWRSSVARSTDGLQRSARSEEHTSELQSLMRISYAVFCLKKKKKRHDTTSQMSNHSSYNETNIITDYPE